MFHRFFVNVDQAGYVFAKQVALSMAHVQKFVFHVGEKKRCWWWFTMKFAGEHAPAQKKSNTKILEIFAEWLQGANQCDDG